MQHSSKPPGRNQSGSDRPDSHRSRIPAAAVRMPVVSSVLVQLIATLCLSLAVAICQHWLWPGYVSVWAGGGIAAAVTLFGAWRGLWRRRETEQEREQESDAPRMLMQLYSAELGKLLLAGLLLGLAFKQLPQLQAPWLVAGFALSYLAGVVGMAATGLAAEAPVAQTAAQRTVEQASQEAMRETTRKTTRETKREATRETKQEG
ncbi:MAG: hypothetical protein WBN40_06295 [Pseudomonadales bacterium]